MKVRFGEKTYVGDDEPCWIVAEMSANHQQDFDKALAIIHAAAASGADAIKLQTYTADTITIDSREDLFQIGKESTWAGRNLYELYQEAYTPWEWHPELKRIAEEKGLACFSSPFDKTAVDFLDGLSVPAFKIASFELVDLPLIRYAAQKGKPMILSTGMASLPEIEEAVECVRTTGNEQIILLKCVSAYPAPPEEMNLRTLVDLRERFQCPVGLSDHTLGPEAALAAVVLGARVIEKHFILSRKDGGPDASFSIEPDEFERMVKSIRKVERALGEVSYEPTEKELVNKQFRRSLFAFKAIRKGETFNEENIRSIRPAAGLPPKHYEDILGKKAACAIEAGCPLAWHHVEMNSTDER